MIKLFLNQKKFIKKQKNLLNKNYELKNKKETII